VTLPKPPMLIPAAELFRGMLTRTAAIAVAPIQQGSHDARAAVTRDQARALARATSLTTLLRHRRPTRAPAVRRRFGIVPAGRPPAGGQLPSLTPVAAREFGTPVARVQSSGLGGRFRPSTSRDANEPVVVESRFRTVAMGPLRPNCVLCATRISAAPRSCCACATLRPAAWRSRAEQRRGRSTTTPRSLPRGRSCHSCSSMAGHSWRRRRPACSPGRRVDNGASAVDPTFGRLITAAGETRATGHRARCRPAGERAALGWASRSCTSRSGSTYVDLVGSNASKASPATGTSSRATHAAERRLAAVAGCASEDDTDANSRAAVSVCLGGAITSPTGCAPDLAAVLLKRIHGFEPDRRLGRAAGPQPAHGPGPAGQALWFPIRDRDAKLRAGQGRRGCGGGPSTGSPRRTAPPAPGSCRPCAGDPAAPSPAGSSRGRQAPGASAAPSSARRGTPASGPVAVPRDIAASTARSARRGPNARPDAGARPPGGAAPRSPRPYAPRHEPGAPAIRTRDPQAGTPAT